MKNKKGQFNTIIVEITPAQRQLIEAMNEFCREHFDFNGKTKEYASEYIDRNMTEFKLSSMDNWQTMHM